MKDQELISELQALPGLSRVVIILDRPAHPGNIGAVARAMANTGFSRLRLVSPRQFPHQEAVDFATGAVGVLDHAEIFDSLPAAIADLAVVVAATNRFRGQRQIILTPRELGERLPELLAESDDTQVGLLFGTERSGLETRDVERAGILCQIPTTGHFGSLNLAQAVIIVLYELMLGLGRGRSLSRDPTRRGKRASTDEMERLYEHMESVLTAIDFIKEGQTRHMMGSLRAIFNRSGLDTREVNIVRGLLSEITGACRRAREQG